MSELGFRIAIALFLLLFAIACLVITRPISDGGKLSLKLILVNVAGWLLVLAMDSQGHPPPQLIVFVIFWLINLVLLPAAGVALWRSYGDREERMPYVAAASCYLAVNVGILFLMPLMWLIGTAAGH